MNAEFKTALKELVDSYSEQSFKDKLVACVNHYSTALGEKVSTADGLVDGKPGEGAE